ncbi:MAG TPA: 16S rRNA (adenine(1518)-N(6)/adenine(1519)-N(6))-dimethyltransferase RsmA [Nitrososphaeraceae archaeon]
MDDDKRIYLGQHFLVDFNIISKIIGSCNVAKTDVVLELGTGYGYLTKEISRLVYAVYSYEIEKELYSEAKSYLSNERNAKIFNEDFFEKCHIEFDFFLSNLPYSRSKEVVKWLSFHEFREAILMVQKEFSEKLIARPGDPNFSVISVISQYCFDVEPLFDVKKDSFLPPPQIESKVVRLRRNTKKMTKDIIFSLEYLFSRRNKKIISLLADNPVNYNKIDELDAESLVKFCNKLIDLKQ